MRRLPFYLAFLIGIGVTIGDAQVVYDQASTALEGEYRGVGGAISAQGQRNLSNSQAAINLTDARSNQINNQVASVNAYWEKKGIYSQHQQQEFQKIEADRQRKLQRIGLKSLSTDEFDRTTGAINWPGIYKQAVFNPDRTKLDQIFQKRAKEGMLAGSDYIAAKTAFKDMRAQIRKQRDAYPREIRDQLLRFLLALNHDLDDNLT